MSLDANIDAITADLARVESAFSWARDDLGSLLVGEINRHISEGIAALTDVSSSAAIKTDMQQKALALSKDSSSLISKFNKLKLEQRIVEYQEKDLSGWGRVTKFFWEYLPRFLGGGYVYIPSTGPALDLIQKQVELDAVIKDLRFHMLPEAAAPQGIVSQNLCGVYKDAATGAHVWVKKKDEADYDEFPLEINQSGFEVEGETYSSWEGVAQKICEIEGIDTVTDVRAAQKRTKDTLKQYTVENERDLSGSEWYIKENQAGYVLRQAGKADIPFEITVDGRLTCSGHIADTLQELFPRIQLEECLAEKYRIQSEQTLKEILLKGVTGSYHNGKISIPNHAPIDINLELKRDIQCSFFVAKNKREGHFVFFKFGEIKATEYKIENGLLLFKKEGDAEYKVHEEILLDPKQLPQDPNINPLHSLIEKAKLEKLALEHKNFGGYRFSKREGPGILEKTANAFLQVGERAEYQVELLSQSPSIGCPVTISNGKVEVTLEIKGQQVFVTARTIEELQRKIEEAFPSKDFADFVVGTAALITEKMYDKTLPAQAVTDICLKLRDEQPIPWAIQPPAKGRTIFTITYGSSLEKKLEVTSLLQGGKGCFQSKDGVFRSMEEVIRAAGLRVEDSVQELIRRKKVYDNLVPELTGNKRSLFKWSKEHSFFYEPLIRTSAEKKVLEAQLKEKALTAKNDVAAVYKGGESGQYRLMICSRKGEIRILHIKIQTTPEPLLICGDMHGNTLSSILPPGVTSLSGAKVLEARAISDKQLYSVAKQTFFTDLRSFKEVEAEVMKNAGSVPDRNRVVAVFRDLSGRLCLYTYTKDSNGLRYYIEQDGNDIDVYNDPEKKDWERHWDSFKTFCEDPDSPALSLDALKGWGAGFSAHGKQFFIGNDSRSAVSVRMNDIKGKIPEGKHCIVVYKEGESFYLHSCERNAVPKVRKLQKDADGTIKLLISDGSVKETFRNFEDLCSRLNAQTYAEVSFEEGPLPSVASPSPEPRGAPALEPQTWGSWLDDDSDPISDRQVKEAFPGFVASSEEPKSPHEFRIWVKALAIARTQEEKRILAQAQTRMKGFSVVNLFWLYELALGSTVVKNGTRRQEQAQQITREVLLESLKVQKNKDDLLRYFQSNKEAYGQELQNLLEEIRDVFSPQELTDLNL